MRKDRWFVGLGLLATLAIGSQLLALEPRVPNRPLGPRNKPLGAPGETVTPKERATPPAETTTQEADDTTNTTPDEESAPRTEGQGVDGAGAQTLASPEAAVSPAVPSTVDTEDSAQDGKTQFIRIRRGEDGTPTMMEVSITRYVPASDPSGGTHVDLISAIHIGEQEYYELVNDQFDNYEVVLYELVAPEGTRIPTGGGGGSSGHPIGMMQQVMKSFLELDYQLEHIDYQKENLVHADMTPEEFSESMENRGESLWKMFLQAMGQSMAQQQQGGGSAPNDVELLMALFDKDRALKMKRIFAQQFEDMEKGMMAFDGPNGSTIITERNKVALEGLTEQLAQGKKRIAIFYGGGHYPDMEERMIQEHGFMRYSQRWLPAWDMRDPGDRSETFEDLANQPPVMFEDAPAASTNAPAEKKNVTPKGEGKDAPQSGIIKALKEPINIGEPDA